MRSLILLALLLTGAVVLAVPLRTFTLRDYVHHTWSRELIHYDLAFKPGECWPRGMRVTDAAGIVVPIQLADVTTHPDGSLATATLWFMVPELPADGTVTYTLSGGTKRDAPVKYVTDLALVKGKGVVELTTSLVGARVLVGSAHFATPQPVNAVPAPLQGIRLRGGAWTGRGWLETRHLCSGYAATVTDDGPVYKKVSIRYTFATPDGWDRSEAPFYAMTVRVTAGQEIACITEDYNLGDPAVYQFPQFESEKQEKLWDWWSWRPHDTADNFNFSLLAGGVFKPTHARVLNHNVSIPEKGTGTACRSEHEYALQFATDRFEFGILPWSSGLADQTYYYTLYNPAQTDSDVLSIMPMLASRWLNPDMLPHSQTFIHQHTETANLRTYSTAKGDLFVRAPLSLGRREWAIAVLKNPDVVTAEKGDTVISRLSRKYGSLPLDKVKDWTLEWPLTANYPHLFVKAGDLDGLQARIKQMPELTAALRNEAHISVHRWLLDGNAADAQKAYDEVMAGLNGRITNALDWWGGDGRVDINSFPWHMMTYASHADVLLAKGVLTDEQRKALLARMAFLAYWAWDGEYMPPRKAGYSWGSAGMPVNVMGMRGILTALLTDHPMSKVWVAESAKRLDFFTQQYFAPDGTPFTCIGYSIGTEGGPLGTVMTALKNTGKLGDIKTNYPNFYQYGRFIVDMMTPTDPRMKIRLIPPEGDTQISGNYLSGQIAGLYKECDPELAGNLMWIWLRSGKGLGGFINGAFFLDPTITPVEPKLPSIVYPGYGAFLRAGANTDAESYLGIRFGTFTFGHSHSEGGAFHWYARGVPMALDWGSMYTPQMAQTVWHNTISYAIREHDTPCPGRGHKDCFYTGAGKNWYAHTVEPNTVLDPISDPMSPQVAEVNGSVAAFAAQPAADYVRGEANRHWFQKLPYYNRGQGDGMPGPWSGFNAFDKLEVRHPFTWTRQVAQVNDAGYLVIADDLSGNQELEPAFNFWCMANAVQDAGKRRYTCIGQFGIDCDVFVLAPGTGRIQLGEQRHTSQIGEMQKLVRVYGKAGEGFRMLLYPRKANEPAPVVDTFNDGKLVRVTLPDQTHWILLSTAPVTVTDGPATLTGTAGVIKRWQDGRVQLTLLAPGKLACSTTSVEADHPATAMGK
jgi:hypothetical protein